MSRTRLPSPKPRRPVTVAGRPRKAAVTEPDSDGNTAVAEDLPVAERANRPHRPRLSAALCAAALLLAGCAVWFGLEARNAGTPDNAAFADGAATSAVSGQMSAALEAVFSVDYRDLGKTEAAANQYLTGQAVDQYRQLLDVVKQQAPANQLVLTTRVRSLAVKDIHGLTAHLLVFVDQSTSRAGSVDSSSGGAQIRITATRQDERWRIAEIGVL